MHGLAQDVLVLVLVDVLALVVRLDGQLHLLHRSLLGVQLLHVLQENQSKPLMLVLFFFQGVFASYANANVAAPLLADFYLGSLRSEKMK